MFQARRFGVPVVALVALSLLAGSSAHAIGFGGYLSYGNVSGSVDDVIGNFDLDYDTDRFGIGATLDTNVAKDQLLMRKRRVELRDFELALERAGRFARRPGRCRDSEIPTSGLMGLEAMLESDFSDSKFVSCTDARLKRSMSRRFSLAPLARSSV